jgi:hypothetical protein
VKLNMTLLYIEAEVNDFLRWIEPKTEHSHSSVSDILAQRCPGTRADFLVKPDYVSWRDEDNDLKKRALWAFGPRKLTSNACCCDYLC